jgi:glycosyltransferase involved in cell wall biosynthesis
MYDYSVTFATLNCIEHTKQCIDSLVASGVNKNRIVAVDNASTDGSQEFLLNCGLATVILNRQNLSCGASMEPGHIGASK